MPVIRRLFALGFLLIGLMFSLVPARAADNVPIMKEAELRQMLAGNTVWVLRQDMSQGDEYHLPDGRVFGFNGVENIENGCWDIVADQVCYYYKDDWAKGNAHCWTFRRMGPDRFDLIASQSLLKGYGVMTPGNPRNHTDSGKSWECKRLMSQNRLPALFQTAGTAGAASLP